MGVSLLWQPATVPLRLCYFIRQIKFLLLLYPFNALNIALAYCVVHVEQTNDDDDDDDDDMHIGVTYRELDIISRRWWRRHRGRRWQSLLQVGGVLLVACAPYLGELGRCGLNCRLVTALGDDVGVTCGDRFGVRCYICIAYSMHYILHLPLVAVTCLCAIVLIVATYRIPDHICLCKTRLLCLTGLFLQR